MIHKGKEFYFELTRPLHSETTLVGKIHPFYILQYDFALRDKQKKRGKEMQKRKERNII